MDIEIKLPRQIEEEPCRVRMNLWMSKSMFDYVEYLASRDGRSMSDIVREALKDHINQDKQLNKEK